MTISQASISSRHLRALTLVELLLVLLILAALAGTVLPLTSGVTEQANLDTTSSTLKTLQRVISRYQIDMRQLPQPTSTSLFVENKNNDITSTRRSFPQLQFLYFIPSGAPTFDPVTKLGWHGPYLFDSPGAYQVDETRGFMPRFGVDNDSAPIDAWNNPIVIVSQPWVPESGFDVRWYLKSAGPDGVLEETIGAGDDLSLEIFFQSPYALTPGP